MNANILNFSIFHQRLILKANQIKIEESWKNVLSSEFDKPYFLELVHFLKSEKKKGTKIYPPGGLIFNAFKLTPFDKVKVVIIGQDPYHNPDEAMGLCFSVPEGIRVPPSLKNIYKEMHEDIGFEIPNHGNLTSWANEGVFLLNAMLTVEHKKAGSHKSMGWQKFTDAVIKNISDLKSNVVFLLWGKFAQGKQVLIDEGKHYVLSAAHPSPLARGAFFGNKHFSRCNELLRKSGQEEINWRLI